MRRIGISFAAVVLTLLLLDQSAQAQLLFWRTDGTAGGVWSTSNFWSNPASATGGTVWTSGNSAEFSANSTLTFGTTSVSDVTVDDGVTVTVTAAQTLTLGAVRTFTVGTGSTLTWASQTVTANSAAGIIKNGAGILDLGAMTYTTNMNGGFTLNNGTLIVTGDKALGNGALNLNGGTLQSSGTRAFVPTSIAIGGDFAFAGTGNATWAAPVALGASTRTITNNTTSTATRTFSGVISGGASAGLTFAGVGGSGGIVLSNTNTYSGGTLINAGTVKALADGALGTGNVSLTASGITLTLQGGATNNYINDAASISIVSGAVTNLAFTGTSDAVGGITLGGVAQTTPGTYGSSTSGATFTSAFFAGTGTVTLVPEPSTWTMLGLGTLLLGGAQYFRRKLR